MAERATRIAEDFAPSPALMQYAKDQGVRDVNRMLEDFKDFWSAKSGKDATKVDWSATWRMWARNAGDKDKEKAAREQRFQSRFAPPASMVMSRERSPRRFQQGLETKSPEQPLSPEQRAELNERMRRMGIQRTAH